MRVRLKLFATFRRYLPPGSSGNGHDMDIAAGTSVGDFLDGFGVPIDESAVILVNGRTASPDQALQEGDVVAAFPSMAGG